MFFFYDYWYIVLVMPAILLAMWAQFRVKGTFRRCSQMPTRSRMSGYDSARMVLDRHGLRHVQIEEVRGELSDHFDPRHNVIRLSSAVYHGQNAAAVGVAAHEAGHAVQYAEKYLPMRLRAAIIPATNFGSTISVPLILLGILLGSPFLAWAGVIAFSLATLFQLVTLPVEFNASRRAMRCIEGSGYFSGEEQTASRKVLTAAALTYVAALAVSLANLLRLVLIVAGSRRRN